MNLKIVVVGSLNLDYIAKVDCLPGPGETVAASNLIQRFGGKGANQAVAAARQDARVIMLGCVGADAAGAAYRRHLQAERIDVTGVSRTSDALTGTALIAVDAKAENLIIVAAGANGTLQPGALRNHRRRISSAAGLLLQFEIPMRTVIHAVRLANAVRVPVTLNPSPLREGFPWGKWLLDTLVANAGEAECIFGLPVASIPRRLASWRAQLARRKVKHLVITRGSNTTLCLTSREFFEVPTLRVKPVDTVGAGDAFAGTYVARRAEGLDLRSAIACANCAGALTTLKPGAQEAIPTRTATERARRRLAEKL